MKPKPKKKVPVNKTFKNEKAEDESDVSSDDSMPELESFEGGDNNPKAAIKRGSSQADVKQSKIEKKKTLKKSKTSANVDVNQIELKLKYQKQQEAEIMREVRDRPVYSGWRLTKEDQESKNKTKILYNNFRRMKDEKREETHEKQQAEERETLKKLAAASKGQSLQGISQFDKQANEVEYMDYVSKPKAQHDSGKLADLKKAKNADLS